MVKSSASPPRGPDINAMYSPATAPTEVEAPEVSEEAALGRSGANALLAVTGLELVGTSFMFFVMAPAPPPPLTLGIAYGIVAMFAGLYVWARSSPYPACIAGLALYLLIQLLGVLIEPSSLAQGILVKVIVVMVLVSSIRNIHRFRAMTGGPR